MGYDYPLAGQVTVKGGQNACGSYRSERSYPRNCLSGWPWRCRGGVLSRGQSDQFRRSNSRCPLLPSASVVLLPSGRIYRTPPVTVTTARRSRDSEAHVARNELAAKHAVLPLSLRSAGACEAELFQQGLASTLMDLADAGVTDAQELRNMALATLDLKRSH